MTILKGKQADNWEQAAELVQLDTENEEISLETIRLFDPLVDRDKLHDEARKAIGSSLHRQYPSKKPQWHGQWWYVSFPQAGYDSRDVPQIEFEVSIYLVAAVKVETCRNIYSLTLVETLGRPEKLVMPLLFLQDLLDNNLDWMRVVGRRPGLTIREIPGIKPIALPDKFLEQLEKTLKRQSVVDWVRSFGDQGCRIAPLVCGAMLGSLFAHGIRPRAPLVKQGWTEQQLVSKLEEMAYSHTEAQQMVNQALPYLKPEMVLEEIIKIVLHTATQGGINQNGL